MDKKRYVHKTLMCRGHEACSFTYDLARRRVVGKVKSIETAYIPFAAQTQGGSVDANGLSAWISRRAVPRTRKNVKDLLDAVDLGSTEELMLFGPGLSLSDQYWFRPEGCNLTWDEVSLYGKDFPPEVGQALVPADNPSRSSALDALARHREILSSSPDTALNGNLPKFWASEGGRARLYKTGKRSNLMLEPFCEAAATEICAALLPAGAFVPYELNGERGGRPIGSCPAFTDENTEFVPAGDVFHLAPKGNHLSRYERYARLLESRGIADARAGLARMLAVDHVIGNFDRHWGNFGVLVDAETREWIGLAPLFDMGESFDCDRATSPTRPARRMPWACPFTTRIDEQAARYAEDLGWFNPSAATAAAGRAMGVICTAPGLALLADRYAEIKTARIAEAIKEVEACAIALRHLV